MGGMAFVIDDIAYICGGENNGSDVTDFWCFNPATGTWKELRELYDKSDDDYDTITLLSSVLMLVLS